MWERCSPAWPLPSLCSRAPSVWRRARGFLRPAPLVVPPGRRLLSVFSVPPPLFLAGPSPADRFVWVVLPWLGLAWAAGALRLWRLPAARLLRVPVVVTAAAVVIGYCQ